MRSKMFVSLSVVMVLASVLAGCVSMPALPASVVSTVVPRVVPSEPKVVVAASALSAAEIPTNTLFLANTGGGKIVVGPRSAFPAWPPQAIGGAVALLDLDKVPAGAEPLGEVYLGPTWDLPFDQVVVLSSEPIYFVKSSLAGKLALGSSPGISGTISVSGTTPLSQDWEMGLVMSPVPSPPASTDPIQWFCLWSRAC